MTTDDDDLWHPGRYDMYYQSLLHVAQTGPRDQVVSLCAPHFVTPLTAALRDSVAKPEDVERGLAAQQLEVRTTEEGIGGFAWKSELWSYLVPFRVLNEYFARQRQPALLRHPLADVDIRSFITSHPGFADNGGKTAFIPVPLPSSWCYFYRQLSREGKLWEVEPWPGKQALRARYERLLLMVTEPSQLSVWHWFKQMVTLFWMQYRWDRPNEKISLVLEGLRQVCRPRVERGSVIDKVFAKMVPELLRLLEGPLASTGPLVADNRPSMQAYKV